MGLGASELKKYFELGSINDMVIVPLIDVVVDKYVKLKINGLPGASGRFTMKADDFLFTINSNQVKVVLIRTDINGLNAMNGQSWPLISLMEFYSAGTVAIEVINDSLVNYINGLFLLGLIMTARSKLKEICGQYLVFLDGDIYNFYFADMWMKGKAIVL